MEKTVAVEMKGISKSFGKTQANKKVDLTVYKGEILAVLGENGCGKTTLMNMLAGIYFPDEGQIFVGGKEVVIRSPHDAFENKIGMIHQHFKLVNIFTAAENIILGTDEKGKFDIKEVNAKVREIANKYGFNIDPEKKIYDMSVSEKQTVEIIKVLYHGADVLILDEPTAVLTPQETEKLFDVIKAMKEDGKSVIIITHKLHEVLAVSDRVAILRKGEHIATVNTCDATEQSLTEMMVGKKVSLNIERGDVVNPQTRLEVKDLYWRNSDGIAMLDHISFNANGGEILGIAGIAGSGQKELLESIAGLLHLESGELIFHRPKKDLPVSFYHKSFSQIVKMAKEGKYNDEKGDPISLKGKGY